MALIGIDLGTTNSLAAVWRDGQVCLIPNSLGKVLTPSVVSIDEDGSICVGEVAKERLISHPDKSAASFKRFMGTDKVFYLSGREFRPEELSSLVLRQLKEDAERWLKEEVTEAVISVPAYFNDNQRYATKQAGVLAGLKVERLINEPSAAALASSMISGKEEQTYLVFDFGGGTLDVSLVDYFDNVIEIVAVSGDNRLGGNDFDQRIAEYFCGQHNLKLQDLGNEKRAILMKAAEACKKELTEKGASMLRFTPEAEELGLILTNKDLVAPCSDLFDRVAAAVRRALTDSRRTVEEIDEIVLVGGSCKMPVVTFYLENLLGKKPIMIGSPDEVVAQGAGTYAGIKARNEEVKDLLLTDICPFTLGAGIYNPSDPSNPIMSPIIERNSVLPTSKAGQYTTIKDNQERITIDVYQGESYYCCDNLKLGELEMKLDPAPRGVPQIEIRFTYDINGLLQVQTRDWTGQHQAEKLLTSRKIAMSEHEVRRRLEELKQYKLQPWERGRTRLVMARGERLFAELTGEPRRAVEAAMQALQEALITQNDQHIAKICHKVSEFFDRLEGQ